MNSIENTANFKEADNDSQEYFYTMVETPLVCWFRFLSPQVGSGTALRNTFKFFHEYHMQIFLNQPRDIEWSYFLASPLAFRPVAKLYVLGM